MTQVEDIRDVIVRTIHPLKIILFGSYAAGTAVEESDLDLFIVHETDLPRPRRAAEVRKHLYGLLDVNKDIIVMTPAEMAEWCDVEHSFVNTVLSQGKVIYERP